MNNLAQAVGRYVEAIRRDGVGSGRSLVVREAYRQLKDFGAYADALDEVRRRLQARDEDTPDYQPVRPRPGRPSGWP